jgi:prepilin-type N-terminal cleavage/methylation domain-containing protein
MWRRRDGFTFLELAMVVLIMGIMMGITFPRFSAFFSKANIGATARRLAGTMGYLRNAAARDGQSYFLNLDQEKNEYWVTVIKKNAELSQVEYQDTEVLDDEMYIEVKNAFLSRVRLEKKIAFAGVILEDGTKVLDQRVIIEFRPDGTADEAVVRLTDARERAYSVYVEHYNGQATVYKYAVVPEVPPTLTEREPPRRPDEAL